MYISKIFGAASVVIWSSGMIVASGFNALQRCFAFVTGPVFNPRNDPSSFFNFHQARLERMAKMADSRLAAMWMKKNIAKTQGRGCHCLSFSWKSISLSPGLERISLAAWGLRKLELVYCNLTRINFRSIDLFSAHPNDKCYCPWWL